MADPTGDVIAEPSGAGSTDASGAVSTGSGDGKSASDTIRELKRRAQDSEKRAAALEKAEQERLEREALARGEHEKVIEELRGRIQALEPKAELASQIEAERREELLARLPESARPFAADLDTAKLRSFVELNGAIKAPTPPVTSSAPGASGVGGKASPEEIQANGWKPGWLEANKHRL